MKSSVDRLLYLPEHRSAGPRANSYGEQMLVAWRRAGFELASSRPRSVRAWVAALAARRRTVAVVNWLENELVDDRGRATAAGWLHFHRKLLALRLFAARLVYVRHNRHPHHTRPADVARVERTIAHGLRRVDVVLSHDFEIPASGVRHLPHPAYPLPLYPGPDSARHVVCFGRIDPYKSLDQLVQSWRGDLPLVIAGRVQDPAYLARLRELAAGRAVRFHTEPLSDDEAARLLAASWAAIVAHSPPSMIVSGSLYFALSCGVPVLAVGQPHARRLQQAGQAGIRCIDSLEQLATFDWMAFASADRAAIRADVQRRGGVEAMARLLPTLLEDDASPRPGPPTP